MTRQAYYTWEVEDLVITVPDSVKGGPGSGNFGHAGRPGQVGGSFPKDSVAADDEDDEFGTLDFDPDAWIEVDTREEMERLSATTELGPPYDSEVDYSRYQSELTETLSVEDLKRAAHLGSGKVSDAYYKVVDRKTGEIRFVKMANPEYRDSVEAELVSAELGKILGLPMVPIKAAVSDDLGEYVGLTTVSPWERSVAEPDWGTAGTQWGWLAQVSDDFRSRVLLFDMVVENADRHAFNFSAERGGKPVLFDQGLAFQGAASRSVLYNNVFWESARTKFTEQPVHAGHLAWIEAGMLNFLKGGKVPAHIKLKIEAKIQYIRAAPKGLTLGKLAEYMDKADREANKAVNKGGPGSGNFGHAGRPGQVGGSAPRLAEADAVLRDEDYELGDLDPIQALEDYYSGRDEAQQLLTEMDQEFQDREASSALDALTEYESGLITYQEYLAAGGSPGLISGTPPADEPDVPDAPLVQRSGAPFEISDNLLSRVKSRLDFRDNVSDSEKKAALLDFWENGLGMTGDFNEDALRGVFEFGHGPVSGELAGIYLNTRSSNGDRYVVIHTNLLDSSGRKIGNMARNIQKNPDGTIEAHHSIFEISESFQNTGYATAWLEQAETWYRAVGVNKITLTANLNIGGYAWARLGFDFADPIDLQFFTKVASNYAEDNYGSNYVLPEFKHSWEIAAWKGPDGAAAGKAVMLGGYWEAVKELTEEFPGYSVGQLYYKIKKRMKENAQ